MRRSRLILSTALVSAGFLLCGSVFAQTKLSDYEGQYRTNAGTLLTLMSYNGGLNGQSQTVGPEPQFGDSLQLDLDGNVLRGPAYKPGHSEKPLGTLELRGAPTRPLVGAFSSGPYKDRLYVACPIVDGGTLPWNDAALRGGGNVWAKLLKADAQVTARGIRLNAQFQVWSVSGTSIDWKPNLAHGQRHSTSMRTTAVYGGPAATVLTLGACGSKIMNFYAEGELEGIDGILNQEASGTTPQPWNLSNILDAARAEQYQPTPQELEVLRGLRGVWRSQTGHSLIAQSVSPQIFALSGGETATDTLIRLDARYMAPGRLVGRWQETRFGAITYTADVEIDPSRAAQKGIVQEMLNDAGERKPLVLCRRDEPDYDARRYADNLWIGVVAASRHSDGKGVKVQLQVQSVAGTTLNLDFRQIRFALKRDDGANVIAASVTASGTPTPINGSHSLTRCGLETFTLDFPNVPFSPSQIEMKMGDETVFSLPVSAPAPTPPIDTGPNPNYKQTQEDIAALAALKGIWRSNTGYEVELTPSPSGLRMIGSQPISPVSFELGVSNTAPLSGTGYWYLGGGGQNATGGNSYLSFAGGKLTGLLFDKNMQSTPISFCRSPAKLSRSRFVGRGIFMRAATYVRDTAGGAVITLEVQNALPTGTVLDFRKLLFSVKSYQSSVPAKSIAIEGIQVTGERSLASCQVETYELRFPDAVAIDVNELILVHEKGETNWFTPIARGIGTAPATTPSPTEPQSPSTPTPTPAPTPSPAPTPLPPPTQPVPQPRPGTGGGVPAALSGYSNYGIWDFKLLEFSRDADGDWQAVVSVRDAASYRVGLSTGGVILVLYDEDGRSIQSDETLYRASVRGTGPQLEGIPQTMWMEKGDEIRVRMFFRRSKNMSPVRIRLMSGDKGTLSRTFPLQ